jgi:hypothetical protein
MTAEDICAVAVTSVEFRVESTATDRDARYATMRM